MGQFWPVSNEKACPQPLQGKVSPPNIIAHQVTVQDTQYKVTLKCVGLLASIERCTLKQGKGNLKTQTGRKFIHSATSRTSFGPMQQFIVHALSYNLYLPWQPYMQFHEFLEQQKHKFYLYQNKSRINYLIYRIVQKY